MKKLSFNLMQCKTREESNIMANQAVTQKQTESLARINEEIKSNMQVLTRLLPPDMEIEQFRAATWLEVRNQYQLDQCFPDTVVECVVLAATYALLPGRDCHFLPFRDNKRRKGMVATFVPNYFGIIRALDRTGKVAKAFAHPVHLNDDFEVDYFSDRPKHIPAKAKGLKPGPIQCFYGAILLKNGTCHFEVMSLDDIEAIKKRAPAHDGGPWVTDFEQMARKTCIKRVAKYVQLTHEMRELISDDDERLLTDISTERAQKNIADLYGAGYQIPRMTGVPDSVPDDLPVDSELDWRESVADFCHTLGNKLTPMTAALRDDEELAEPWASYQALLKQAMEALNSGDVSADEGNALAFQLADVCASLAGDSAQAKLI